jgi:hypothetical protein
MRTTIALYTRRKPNSLVINDLMSRHSGMLLVDMTGNRIPEAPQAAGLNAVIRTIE